MPTPSLVSAVTAVPNPGSAPAFVPGGAAPTSGCGAAAAAAPRGAVATWWVSVIGTAAIGTVSFSAIAEVPVDLDDVAARLPPDASASIIWATSVQIPGRPRDHRPAPGLRVMRPRPPR